ncbi:hypothetical protein GCM10011487_28680 [Steroidobacter agaridevorans]|uniref:Uncharacterized protein n=1 Tax=Steroidobacter agaridevorans TaxID=2695856 RepID=A0A829YDF9_9GAMM|nr:hypothetical protein [Steroidobacter agaridevorans]GFE80868.1 hypothetical protein GCM10011487_28680 [Steroidobacter agaridevorans]
MLLLTLEREIEAALGGPLAVADIDIDGGSFFAKLWLIASVADAVALSRIGEMRCGDSELRQWIVCVTFSASPKTVTHAWRNAAVGAALCSDVVRRIVAAGVHRWTANWKRKATAPE